MHESGENYLETILMIKEKKGVVRSIDVARALNFSKPSVSRAMGLLRDQGFISMEQGGDIQLTEEGPYKGKIHLRASPSPDCFLTGGKPVFRRKWRRRMPAVWNTSWIRQWSTGSAVIWKKENKHYDMPGVSCPAYLDILCVL